MTEEKDNCVVPFRRQLSARDMEEVDQATRDILSACRAAYLLLSDARRRLGLAPLPPPA